MVASLIMSLPATAALARTVDESATRVDTDVFGWNADFTQLAAVASNSHRGANGDANAQLLLVVWGTNSVRPLKNVKMDAMGSGSLQKEQLKLTPGGLVLVGTDEDLAKDFTQRPVKEKPQGWMSVETIWDPVSANGDECQAAVGFILEARGRIRFQPHEVIPGVKAKCRDLRMTHVRTYWGRPDVAAAMAKFEWSPDEREMSFRQPVSARWSRARELNILVRTNDPNGARTDRVTRALAKYGRIRIEGVGRGNKSGVTSTQQLALLANRMGNEIDLPREHGPVDGGTDIVVTLGDDDPVRAAARGTYPRITYR